MSCGAYYPNDAYTTMIYGPFDLSSATDAEVTFYRWHQTEVGPDCLSWMASIDASSFYGSAVCGGSGGWQYTSFDLTDVYSLGDVTGQPQVWIGFWFTSNSTNNYPEGVYVDDITIRAKIGGE